jgi:hypothetical protein
MTRLPVSGLLSITMGQGILVAKGLASLTG